MPSTMKTATGPVKSNMFDQIGESPEEVVIVVEPSSQPSDEEFEALVRSMGWVKPEEVAPVVLEVEFLDELRMEPVEYWNAERPNEVLVIREAGPKNPKTYDAATERSIAFMGGYFRATEPWQVEYIEKFCADRAFRSDILPPAEPLRCGKCYWESRSSRAMMYHMAQES